MFWGWLSVPVGLLVALFAGIGRCCAKIFGLVSHLLSGVNEEIPTLKRRKRENLYEKRVVAMLTLVGLLYAVSLIQGIFIPTQMVARIEPLRPPVVATPFNQRWQNPECPACGGDDLDMKEAAGKIAPAFITPHWKIEDKIEPMPWYLVQPPTYRQRG